MEYEVERKFRVASCAAAEEKLARLGAWPGSTCHQTDLYFAHPVRDFAQTDEAVRLRRIGSCNLVAYKGPKIDAVTKTRREIEVPLADGEEAAAGFAAWLAAVGFHPVAEVRKRRWTWRLPIGERQITVALDEVEGLGSFVELEIIADQDELDAARELLAVVAQELDLGQDERRSYLELLLAP